MGVMYWRKLFITLFIPIKLPFLKDRCHMGLLTQTLLHSVECRKIEKAEIQGLL